MSRRPSYFDDEYDEFAERSARRTTKRQRFSFKALLQIIGLLIIMAFKSVRDLITKTSQKLQEAEEIEQRQKEERRADSVSSRQKSTVTKKRRRGISYKKKLSLTLTVVSILIFSILIGSVMLSVRNENRRISQFNEDAGQVCASYVKKYGVTNYENLYTNYNVEGYRMTGLSYARELDFNNDGVSELLVCYNDSGTYIVEVWGYSGKDFINLYHGKACQTNNVADDSWITLYYHNGKYYVGSHDKKDITKVSLMGMRGDKFVKKYDAVYDEIDQAFSIDDEVDLNSFERIKLGVLREEKASVTFELVCDIIDGFKLGTTDVGTSKEIKETPNRAYSKVISELETSYGKAKLVKDGDQTYIDGVALARLIDFNNDGTDELLVAYRRSVVKREENSDGDYMSVKDTAYYTEVYTFKNNKAVRVYQKDSASQKLQNDVEHFVIIQNDGNKHNLCTTKFNYQENNRVIIATSNILEFDGKELKPKFKSKYISDYGYKTYYIDDEQVYSREFNEKGYVVPFFDGESSYSSTQFDVMYLKRYSNNNTDVENQYEETKRVIEKLND